MQTKKLHSGWIIVVSVLMLSLFATALTWENISDIYFDFSYVENYSLVQHNSTEWRFEYNITNQTDGVRTYYNWCNDTAGNENTSDVMTLTVDTSGPDITIGSPENQSHHNQTMNISLFVNDAANVSLVYCNVTNMTDELVEAWNLTYDSGYYNTTLDTTSHADGNYTIICWANDTFGYSTETAHNFTIDNFIPMIVVDYPLNNSYYSPATQNMSYKVTLTDTNPYILNATFCNSTDILFTLENTTPIYTTLGLEGVIDLTGLPDGNYTWNATGADAHCDNDIGDLKKGKKGETELVINASDNTTQFNMTVGFVEKSDKATDSPGDLTFWAENSDDNTKINFGLNFTVLKPETKMVFNLTIAGAELKYLNSTDYKGHIIWYPYGIDFEGEMLVNNVRKNYSVVVTEYGSSILVKVVPDENLAGNDEVEIRFESIFGLNVVEETYNIVLGSGIPSIEFIPPTPTNDTTIQSSQTINISANDTNIRNITIHIYNLTDELVAHVYLPTGTEEICNYSWNTTAFADGQYFVNATIYDNATNSNTTGTMNFTVDDTAPQILTYSPVGSVPLDTTLVNISVTTNEWAQCYYLYGGTEQAIENMTEFPDTNSTNHNVTLVVHNCFVMLVHVKCNDSFNNSNQVDTSWNFNVLGCGGGNGCTPTPPPTTSTTTTTTTVTTTTVPGVTTTTIPVPVMDNVVESFEEAVETVKEISEDISKEKTVLLKITKAIKKVDELPLEEKSKLYLWLMGVPVMLVLIGGVCIWAMFDGKKKKPPRGVVVQQPAGQSLWAIFAGIWIR